MYTTYRLFPLPRSSASRHRAKVAIVTANMRWHGWEPSCVHSELTDEKDVWLRGYSLIRQFIWSCAGGTDRRQQGADSGHMEEEA